MSAARSELEAGLREHQAGRLESARSIYQQVVTQHPRCADAWHLLGTVCWQEGQAADAERYIRRAIEFEPVAAVFHENLARILESGGNLTEAAVELRRAADLSPGSPELHFRAAELLMQAGDLPAACAACEDGLVLEPTNAGAWNNLGSMCRVLQDFEGSVACYREAVRHAPQSAAIRNNLGLALQTCGQLDEAIDQFRQALRQDAAYVKARYNLARALADARQPAEAVSTYERVVADDPGFAAAWENLGALHAQQGQTQSARGCFDRALAIRPSDGLKLRLAFTLPLVPSSVEEIDRERKQFEAAIDRLAGESLSVEDPLRDLGVTPFNLAYHGRDDRPLVEKMVRLMRQAAPSLNYTAPHCDGQPVHTTGERIRIGFLSRYFGNHSVGAHYSGLIEQLPPDRFEVFVLEPGHRPGDSPARATTAEHAVSLPLRLSDCRERIAECRLDVLYYPDLGMDPLTWMLAFARLAPVQCVSTGHPVTSGIDTIDYFISDRDLEPADAQGHYTEQLVQLDGFPIHFTRPKFAPGATRNQFGLPQGRLYVCPQAPFKFHPEFDALLAEILATDPEGTLLLFEGRYQNWTRLLVQRLSARIPQFRNRVKILPRLPLDRYLQVLHLCDVALDTIHFSGGTTTMHLVAAGTPVVTWPGEFMRSRCTAAVLEKLGVTDTIADSAAAYVRLATGLAADRSWRNRISREMQEASPTLFDTATSITGLERFLLSAVEQATMRTSREAGMLDETASATQILGEVHSAGPGRPHFPLSAVSDGPAESAPAAAEVESRDTLSSLVPEPHIRLNPERERRRGERKQLAAGLWPEQPGGEAAE